MSKKVMATIGRGLIFPDDSEKTFENQYICLEAGIECKGTLIFRNGKLEMDGREATHPGQDFLSSWNMVIQIFIRVLFRCGGGLSLLP